MLRLLLDVHVPWRVADGVAAQRPGSKTVHLARWQGGQFRDAADETILKAALGEGLTLVTYDAQSIRPLLSEWSRLGLHHAGVVMVDERTIPANDIGGLVRALVALYDAEGSLQWLDRVVYLLPVRR